MPSREYPERPVVGVGGVVIVDRRALLIRRGSEPLRGEWSIPGGMLELGETLQEGVARELQEETGLQVRVLDLIEVFDRIVYAESPAAAAAAAVAGLADTQATATQGRQSRKPRYHYVIADYLCERIAGVHAAASDVTEVEFAREDELSRFRLTETALRVLHKAFHLDRTRIRS
jgi:8-oxo-dGTP diphosphatase